VSPHGNLPTRRLVLDCWQRLGFRYAHRSKQLLAPSATGRPPPPDRSLSYPLRKIPIVDSCLGLKRRLRLVPPRSHDPIAPPGFAICWLSNTRAICGPDANVNDMMTFMPSSRRTIFELAEQHSGWFRTSDAVASGVTRQQLARYAASGVLTRTTHGVYRVIEACLWAGPGAVASHHTALAIYGLGDAMPASIHITVPHRLRKSRPGVIVHIADVAADRTGRDGVPVTSVLRTILDVAGEMPAKDISALITEAEQQGLLGQREAKPLRKSLAVSV
jgi:hypothetical protein